MPKARRPRATSIVALALITLVMVACASSTPPAVVERTVVVTQPVERTVVVTQPAAVVTKEVPVTPVAATPNPNADVLRIWMGQSPPELNPLWKTDPHSNLPLELAFDRMVDYGPGNEIVPRMASRWDISDDGLKYTFYLRKDVKWHDGQPFTAKDVEFTYRSHLDKRTGAKYSSLYTAIDGAQDFYDGKAENVRGIKILDDYTVQFVLSSPNAAFLGNLPTWILPEHILGAIPPEKQADSDFMKLPNVGTGPYKLVKYATDQYLEYDRFDDYYLGKPSARKVFIQISEAETGLAQLERGEVDYMFNLAPPEAERAAKLPGVEVRRAPNLNWPWMLIPNFQRPFLQDVRVRQAMQMSLDREGLLQSLMLGYGTVINVPITCAGWAVPANDQLSTYPYDPEAAKKLLAEAGWDPNRTLKILYYASAVKTRQEYPPAVQQLFEQIGIKTELDFIDVNAAVEKINTADFDLLLAGGGGVPCDPDGSSVYFSTDGMWPKGYNAARYSNKDADALFAKGRLTTDPVERTKIYQDLNKLLNKDLPWILLAEPDNVSAAGPRLANVHYDPNRERWALDVWQWQLK